MNSKISNVMNMNERDLEKLSKEELIDLLLHSEGLKQSNQPKVKQPKVKQPKVKQPKVEQPKSR